MFSQFVRRKSSTLLPLTIERATPPLPNVRDET